MVERKSIRIKIMRNKHESGYRKLKVIKSNAKYETGCLHPDTTDSLEITIPPGVDKTRVEAMESNEFNIFYEDKS